VIIAVQAVIVLIVRRNNLLGITILLNNACNKKCKYCYENNTGEYILTESNIDSIIERIKKIPKLDRDIEFFGGEPTLSLNVIKYATERYPEFIYRIISNGYFLNLPEYEYSFLSKLHSITISIEGTETAFIELRNGKNLKEVLDKIINLNKKWNNLGVNISINGLLNKNIDEFINNCNYLLSNGVGIHFYSLKGENFFDTPTFYSFLQEVKKKDKKIYDLIILNDGEKSDTEFLCSLNNRLVINPKMEIVECAWINSKIADLSNTNEDILYSFSNGIAKNHKTLFAGCKNCEVELGKCSISCKAFIEECLKNNKIDLLDNLCSQEKIKEYLRREQ
jgi:MoaA/NifB/PqqE/SkfB family radical SAM enzyme